MAAAVARVRGTVQELVQGNTLPSVRAKRERRCTCANARDYRSDGLSHGRCGDKFDTPKRLHEAIYPRTSSKEVPDQENPTRDGLQKPTTVYTVRLNTSNLRGSALDDFNAGVQVCMIGRKGQALLHRIPQIEDSQDSQDMMKVICTLVGEDGGAKCDISDDSQSKYHTRAPFTRRRFTEGSVDEISFVGVDLGPLTGILVGPEHGRWTLDEVSITNSRENITQQFICREPLGQGDSGAAYMTPLPPGAVLYGSGQQAVLLTKDQAEKMRSMGLKEYGELKRRILNTTAVLVILGMAVAGATGGVEAAEAFALGGVLAFLNHFFVSQSVDRLPLGAAYNGSPYSAPDVLGQQALGISLRNDWARGLLGNGPLRLATTTVLMLASLLFVQLWDYDVTDQQRTTTEFSTLLTALLGFGMYKVAMVAVTLSPSHEPAEEEARTVEKL